MLLPRVLVRSSWDKLLLLLPPFNTSSVFSMSVVFCVVCLLDSSLSEKKFQSQKAQFCFHIRVHVFVNPLTFCLQPSSAPFRRMFTFSLAILPALRFTCVTVYRMFICTFVRSRIRERAFMRSAACVCVCVFYKLALEPSGLIMWPGNYTGLSEEVTAAWHQSRSGLGLREEKRCV